MQTTKTTRTELQELQDVSLVLNTSIELLNVTSLETNSEPVENSMFCSHLGSDCNDRSNSVASMSGERRIFVLGYNKKPLTPCKPNKARKLLFGGVAKVVWNKFGEFGIQMLIQTREETPKTILGIDNGTKFEGLSLITGSENQLNIMWLLPNKKLITNKLEERRILRRARRWRNCRRRECRFDNRNKDGFIAPSQLMIVQSRLKAIQEFFKCYPINKVAIEDVKFNHRDKKWGKNFSTMEVGKNMIKCFIIGKVGRDNYITFEGFETEQAREKRGLKKSSNKALETFNSHCVDSFSIASELSNAEPNFNIKVIDDTYRPIRRQLHMMQFSKGGKRKEYSKDNFNNVKKGSICELGLIAGGTGKYYSIYPTQTRDNKEKRIRKSINKISWLSHKFKIKQINHFGGSGNSPQSIN